MEYEIVEQGCMKDLAEVVQLKLDMGWVPHGIIIKTQYGYAQAVTRELSCRQEKKL